MFIIIDLLVEEKVLKTKETTGEIQTYQEFLNFGTFSSFNDSAIEYLEDAAQPLHGKAASYQYTIYS